jgi:hypothetical protein
MADQDAADARAKVLVDAEAFEQLRGVREQVGWCHG